MIAWVTAADRTAGPSLEDVAGARAGIWRATIAPAPVSKLKTPHISHAPKPRFCQAVVAPSKPWAAATPLALCMALRVTRSDAAPIAVATQPMRESRSQQAAAEATRLSTNRTHTSQPKYAVVSELTGSPVNR